MKKLLLMTLLTGLASISTVTFADDAELEQAPATYIQSLIAMCKEDAVEDDVPADELKDYLLECVNDDLSANDYNTITSLPSA